MFANVLFTWYSLSDFLISTLDKEEPMREREREREREQLK